MVTASGRHTSLEIHLVWKKGFLSPLKPLHPRPLKSVFPAPWAGPGAHPLLSDAETRVSLTCRSPGGFTLTAHSELGRQLGSGLGVKLNYSARSNIL